MPLAVVTEIDVGHVNDAILPLSVNRTADDDAAIVVAFHFESFFVPTAEILSPISSVSHVTAFPLLVMDDPVTCNVIKPLDVDIEIVLGQPLAVRVPLILNGVVFGGFGFSEPEA